MKTIPLFALLIPAFAFGANIPKDVAKLIVAAEKAGTNTATLDAAVADFTAGRALLPAADGKTLWFVYYDPAHRREAVNVALSGSWNGFSTNAFLARAGNSQLFYTNLSLDDPDDATYSFQVFTADGSVRVPDPLNPIIRYAKITRSLVRLPDSPRGTLRVYPQWKPVGALNPKRSVYAWLPPRYFAETNRRYPVLYMHDGQQVWDSEASAKGGWKADTTAEKLILAGKIEPLIIVGVENSAKRVEEFIGYSAYHGLTNADEKVQEKGDEYSRGYRDFFTLEVREFVDMRFRTKKGRENTAIAGSSFGASVSLWIGFTRPALYSAIGSFSGGNYLPNDATRKEKNFYQPFPFLAERIVNRTNAMKIYLDCGGQDVDAIFLPRTEAMYSRLTNLGFADGKDLKYSIDRKAGHNEPEWARRFPAFLEFVFGAKK